MMKSSFRNARLEVLRGTAAALHSVGALDKTTMRDLDAQSDTPVFYPKWNHKVAMPRKAP